MKSVKLFLYILLLTMDITCSADGLSGLVSGENVSESASGDSGSAAKPVCTINQPTVNYCISVYDGKPVIRALSQVISSLSTPLTFSLSYKNGVPPNTIPPVIMDASCIDQNCTALFLIEPVYAQFYKHNLTVNVTVSAEDCSNSTVKMSSELIWINEIVDVTVVEVKETRATIVCKLSCFSEDIGCIPEYGGLIISRIRKTMRKIAGLTFHISNITGNPYSYSYPSQNITVTNLASGKHYFICVHAYNLTTTQLLGFSLCENFTTIHHEGISGAVIATITIIPTLVVVFIVAYIIYYCHKKYLTYQKNRPLHWFDMEQRRRKVEYEAASDDISLPSAEYTDSV